MSAYSQRRLLDLGLRLSCGGALLLALLPLVSVCGSALVPGIAALASDMSATAASEGLVRASRALVASLASVFAACSLAVPFGILAGVHLAEYEPPRLRRAFALSADCLSGMPSISLAVFGYAAIGYRSPQISTWVGGAALAILMLPRVAQTTERLLRAVPDSVREAALGLGVSRGRTALCVLLPAAARPIAVSVVAIVSRVLGEAAPLLFIASGSRRGERTAKDAVLPLPLEIFYDSVSPEASVRVRAWTSALVLLSVLLLLNVLARYLGRAPARSS